MPTGMRGGSAPLAARLWKAICRPLGAALRAAPAPMPAEPASSWMEFQAPQLSHLPCHRLVTAPQLWQTKAVLVLVIGRPVGPRARQAAPVPSPI